MSEAIFKRLLGRFPIAEETILSLARWRVQPLKKWREEELCHKLQQIENTIADIPIHVDYGPILEQWVMLVIIMWDNYCYLKDDDDDGPKVVEDVSTGQKRKADEMDDDDDESDRKRKRGNDESSFSISFYSPSSSKHSRQM